ncbi:alpha/beta fold hydrolase [Sanguibacter antarcticus]|uniref:Pimeloyl-ACP methyl ester carboxylesterase n=1 Tax=Sanguibacter antarcticus TaxID=372484 RepID=A0A2A9E7G9_9MICO|nr:alpha/beta hydrolase [Sanguibacter antarcticus]PFG34586.1 pimeloyl-ACP methyl ester carboxylesterase [Sanguibacter antarcticus]
MGIDENVRPGGVLVQPGEPFGGLPVPLGVEPVSIRTMVGELTALYAPAVTRGPNPARSRGTVLLVPGFTGSKEDFLPLLPLLAARGWDTWAYSQRGQADSASPRNPLNYRLGEFATDLLEVADVIGDGSPVHIVGHSFGGLVARAAALRSPKLFADLTFLCSGPKCWSEEIREMSFVVRESGSLGLWEASNPDLVEIGAPPLTSRESFHRYRASQTSPDNLLGIIDILVTAPDTTEQLLNTGVRTLVAHGADDDAWPQQWQEIMARALGARYEVIEDAGHLPSEDNPGLTAAIFDSFWGAFPPATPGRAPLATHHAFQARPTQQSAFSY